MALLVAVVFAAGGAGTSSGFRPPSGPEFLAARQLELPAEDSTHTYAGALARFVDGGAPPPPVEAAPEPVELPQSAPPPPAALERPIVVPETFPERPARSSERHSRLLSPSAGTKQGGIWVVSIGVDDYPGTSGDLRAAVADARKVDAALAAYGVPGSRRLLLTNREASAENIRRSLHWLVANAAADATAVFFFSGHVRQVAGDRDGDGEWVDEAMVGSDGHHVFDGEMAGILRDLEARSMWIGIAACYAGGFDDALAPGRVLTAAAGEHEVAYENSALGHSYLVEYMVRRAMLQGKASGSVQEAFAWAHSQIAVDYPNRLPVMIDHSGGPLMLGQYAPPAPPPPAEASPPSQEEPAQGPPSSPPPEQPGKPPPSSACAEVLGMSVCSSSRSSPKGQVVALPPPQRVRVGVSPR